MSTKYTSEYRNQLFRDAIEGRMPDRVPEKMLVTAACAYEYAGMDLRYCQYGTSTYAKAVDKINGDFDTDTLLGSYTYLATPWYYKTLGSERMIMVDDGFMEHPDHVYMEDTEYDELIADPIKFIWTKVLPRTNKKLAEPYPYNLFAVLKTIKAREAVNAATAKSVNATLVKYNKTTLPMVKADGGKIPADFLGDNLRSFKGMLIDLRRHPDKVEEALGVLQKLFVSRLPVMKEVDRTSRGNTMTHMPTFMNRKQFERFYWPGFSAIQNQRWKNGYGMYYLLEDNWMPYIDYLKDLPRSELHFESGDPETIKKTIGTQHLITGCYDVTGLKVKNPEEACDEAKRIMDIMAPGGSYVFGFGKYILRARGVRWDSFGAVVECVHEYGKY